jgi:hypothetical protein
MIGEARFAITTTRKISVVGAGSVVTTRRWCRAAHKKLVVGWPSVPIKVRFGSAGMTRRETS